MEYLIFSYAILTTIYISSLPGDVSTLLNMTIGCGCPTHIFHQADNLAKLWQESLPLLELIAKIFCAVVIARTSEALGNTQPRVAVA